MMASVNMSLKFIIQMLKKEEFFSILHEMQELTTGLGPGRTVSKYKFRVKIHSNTFMI